MENGPAVNFPETQWSLVLGARGTGAPSRAALETLCSTYWPPLYAFARRAGNSPESSADAVQGYLARLLARGDLATVSPERGRFRSYLLSGFRNFQVSEARHDQADKRGGREETFSLDALEGERLVTAELCENLSPEVAYDRRWAQTVIDRALNRLEAEHATRGRREHFELLKPTLAGEESAGYGDLGRQLGLTEGAVAVAIHRLRSRLREIVRLEVAQTVGTESDLDDELRYLLAVRSE